MTAVAKILLSYSFIMRKRLYQTKYDEVCTMACVIYRLQNIHVLLVKKPEVMLYNRICGSSIMLKDVEP